MEDNKKTKITVEESGRKGGKATVKKYGKEHMKQLSKLAHAKRWGEKKGIKKETRP